MITTADSYIIEAGSLQKMQAAPCYVLPTLHDNESTVVMQCRFLQDEDSIDTGIITVLRLEFDVSDLTAFTASGANDVAKFYNLCEQTVVDYLETLTPSATFTII